MSSNEKRILIVEDQRVIAADIESTLKNLGYTIAGSVASGEEAVPTASEVRPDLILMDIRLRGQMDGIQAAEAIRAETDVPIVYLTAYADEETLLRARATSPFGYLVKPFNERELRAAIEIAISKHETDTLLVEERAKRCAAEEFRLLVECVRDYAIYMLDPAGRVASWNEGAARITGYAADEIRGKDFSVFYTKEEADARVPEVTLEHALREGRTESEGWRVRSDGSRFWANVVLTAVRDEAGQLHGFGTITRDLTERRRDELALRANAARTSAMVTAALDCIVSMEATGRVIEINQAAEKTFGYAHEEAIGKDMADLIIPERLRERHRAGLAAYVRTGAGPILGKRIEMPAVRKDGTEIKVELSVVSLPGAEPPIFCGFLRDITEQKRAEEELRRWEYVFRNAAWGIAISSTDDRFVEVNAAFAAMHGTTAEEWVGRPVTDMFAEESKSKFADLVREVHAKGHLAYESIHVRKDGSTFPVLTDVTAFKDPSGRVLFRAASFQDITALKRTEESLREAIRTRDEFLQIASHELKTPLTPLQLQLDMLTRALEKTGVQNERLTAKLGTASRQAARLSRLVESLLDVSRITAGRVELEIEPMDLSEVMRDVAQRFLPEARRAQSELVVRADTPIIGRWDRLRIEQILSNVITNAIKYGQGKPIEVDASVSDGTVRISVTDHGIGIEKEALGRIFGRFERAVSLRHFGGLGLGLFIARQFAEAHGGSIVAQSQPHAGSTFTVVLPLEATARPEDSLSNRGATT
jgi:PAS domain S-box-containing protein